MSAESLKPEIKMVFLTFSSDDVRERAIIVKEPIYCWLLAEGNLWLTCVWGSLSCGAEGEQEGTEDQDPADRHKHLEGETKATPLKQEAKCVE